MHRNLEILLEVQALELRLRELDAHIASLPKRVASIEAKLTATKQAVERGKAAQTGSQSERRQVEREIETVKAKIDKLRAHSADVKTNQEYKALLDEIAFAEAQIGKHEERILQIMEEAEGLERQLREAEANLQSQKLVIDAETKSAAVQTAADQAERHKLLEQRTRLRGDAEDEWLRRFDRVLRMRGQAMAAIDREACSGCRVRQRPQFLQEMSVHPTRLYVCESCGRILYLAPEPVTQG